MARARNIKPGFYKNEDLAECSIWARFIFPGLWMLADREGRLEDRPKRIKGELLPFDSQDVEPLLQELAEKKDANGVPFIVRYQNSYGRFIQISKFSAHQTPHYSEKPSTIKPYGLQENEPHDEGQIPGGLQEDSKKTPTIKRGSQPPDSLNPDSLNLKPSAEHEKIVFDGSRFQNLNGHLAVWRDAYPAINVDQEIAKAAAWLVANPKNRKSQYARFLNGWLSRAQDRAPPAGGGSTPQGTIL